MVTVPGVSWLGAKGLMFAVGGVVSFELTVKSVLALLALPEMLPALSSAIREIR